MRFIVTCLDCGQRIKLARDFVEPERVRLICPGCESLMVVPITADKLTRDKERTRA